MEALEEELSTELQEITACYHCGGPLDEELPYDEKVFCCTGCKTVYQVLSENGLCDYYELEKTPGIKIKSRNFEGKFDYLDHPDIKKRLLDFSSDKVEKIRIKLPAVHCSSCIWLLENLQSLSQGIIQSRVNFAKKELSLSYNPKENSLKAISELLTTLGYEPDFSLNDFEGKKQIDPNKGIYLRIGVAGFCFGNIMLLSFPEYFGFEGIHDNRIRDFIGYLNFVLALPVFLYASFPYYESAYRAIRKGFINIDFPIVLGIFALFFRSAYEVFSQTGPGYFDSLAGLLFFLLTGKWFQNRTYEGLSFERDYKAYFPIAVSKLNGESVPIVDLKVGDRVLIHNQELIPADARLIKGSGKIDYSFVSGESEPIKITPGELIYAGGKQAEAIIEIEIIKPVSRSYLTGLWNESGAEKADLSQQALINKISKHFTIIVLLIAFGSAIFWLFADSSKAINAFSAVLIVACPCALSMATPYSLGNTMRVFGRNGFYLKNSLVVESLARLNFLVFDKTGTITQADKSLISFKGDDLEKQLKAKVYALAANSTHPLSRRIAEFLVDEKAKNVVLEDYTELTGLGIKATIGKDTLLLGSLKLLHKFGVEVHEITSSQKDSKVWLALNSKAIGYYSIKNQYREGLQGLIDQLKGDFKLSLVSGDNNLQFKELQGIFPENSTLLFNQRPEDKESYITGLQQDGFKVGMIGDGLNDGIALGKSNVGIAINDDITSFTPASDAILDGKSLSKLPKLLKFSKTGKNVVIASFVISFLYNVVGLSFAVSGNLSPIFAAVLMPLSGITVVSFATLSINLLAKRHKLI
jgi:P-type Cu+ transporter